MGRPKLALPFGEELLLQRACRILGEVASPLVVVAAPDQALPPLDGRVEVVRDEEEHLGPLAGLSIGLAALHGRVERAYVSSCDVPLLKPGFVRRMFTLLEDHELAVPHVGGYYHPLAAVYRTSLAEAARRLVSERRLRPLFLIEQARAVIVREEQLRDVDPHLESLRNVNTPEDYQQALRAARGRREDRADN